MIPYRSPSWPEAQRLIAQEVNPLLSGYPYPPLDTAPASVDYGYTYYDTVLNKVRTYTPTGWQNHF